MTPSCPTILFQNRQHVCNAFKKKETTTNMTAHDAAKIENQNLHIYMSVGILANRSIEVGLNSKLAEFKPRPAVSSPTHSCSKNRSRLKLNAKLDYLTSPKKGRIIVGRMNSQTLTVGVGFDAFWGVKSIEVPGTPCVTWRTSTLSSTPRCGPRPHAPQGPYLGRNTIRASESRI